MPLEKAKLRAKYRAMRDNMRAELRAEADVRICQRVCNLPAFEAADTLLSYLSMASEVETRNVLEAAWVAGKEVALPRCNMATHTMTWHRVSSLAGLARSSFGVLEPPDDPSTLVDPLAAVSPLAIVPGLAYDRQRMRIGYGGGFYDRFLSEFPGVSVGLCRDELVVEDLEALGVVEPHDVPVALVVTEHEVIGPHVDEACGYR